MAFRLLGLVSLTLIACAPLRHAPASTSLRVMSYNIQAGAGHLDSTAAAIRAQKPDVVALQEVDVHWSERSAFADQARDLATRLGMQMRFAPIYSLAPATAGQPRREFGVALLTRFPITSFRNDSLTRLSTQEQNASPARMPGLLVATLDVRGCVVTVLTTHLDYRADPAVRARQVDELVDVLWTLDTRTIVAGDMNATPDAPELQRLLRALADAWSAAAPNDAGLTYPATTPAKRIDYVLATRHFDVRAARVPATLASDHRPVVADLELRSCGS